MQEPQKSLNHQLADAVAAVAAANDRLVAMRQRTEEARREETMSLNKVNEAQRHFDDLVSKVKQSAPRDTDWRRPVGLPAQVWPVQGQAPG